MTDQAEEQDTTGKCPIIRLGYAEKYDLSENFVKGWCSLGCCPDCAKMMREYVERKIKREAKRKKKEENK